MNSIGESYKILVLDPAKSTGFCMAKVSKDEVVIFEYGFIDVDTSSNFQGDHCIDLMEKIQILIDQHHIEKIAIEDFFFSKKFAKGCGLNVAFRTAIHIVARKNKIDYEILNVSLWKTFVAGRSTPTREQKKKWGKLAKKFFIQQALWERYGFRFPNHSISKNTNKPIAFRDDIVDAVGQTVYYSCLVLGVKKITMSVVPPSDIIFKKSLKRQFEYP